VELGRGERHGGTSSLVLAVVAIEEADRAEVLRAGLKASVSVVMVRFV
jgi:hypothetical protein